MTQTICQAMRRFEQLGLLYSPLDETAIWLQPICLPDPSGEGCDDRIKKRNLIQFEVYLGNCFGFRASNFEF